MASGTYEVTMTWTGTKELFLPSFKPDVLPHLIPGDEKFWHGGTLATGTENEFDTYGVWLIADADSKLSFVEGSAQCFTTIWDGMGTGGQDISDATFVKGQRTCLFDGLDGWIPPVWTITVTYEVTVTSATIPNFPDTIQIWVGNTPRTIKARIDDEYGVIGDARDFADLLVAGGYFISIDLVDTGEGLTVFTVNQTGMGGMQYPFVYVGNGDTFFVSLEEFVNLLADGALVRLAKGEFYLPVAQASFHIQLPVVFDEQGCVSNATLVLEPDGYEAIQVPYFSPKGGDWDRQLPANTPILLYVMAEGYEYPICLGVFVLAPGEMKYQERLFLQIN
jgi:hypothetical protein